MRYAGALAVMLIALTIGVLVQSQPADAAFHLMRIYRVMGGTGGATSMQYVELRMTTDGQNLVSGHQLCFYNTAGTLTATFTFAGNTGDTFGFNDSILVGSQAFKDDTSVVDPDFVFVATGDPTPDTVDPMNNPVLNPVPAPGGRVVFGTPVGMTPCGSVVDSVAYGGYTGSQPMIFGTPDDETLPTTDTCDDPPDDPGAFACALTFTAALNCPPSQVGCPSPANNQTDYTIRQAKPCNNLEQCSGSVGGPVPDVDGDGTPDASDTDDDGDGFLDTKENSMTTDPRDGCSSDTTGNNEVPDAWPSDADDDRDADVGDVIASFNGKLGIPANYQPRSDFDGDGDIDIGDVIIGFGGGKIGTKCSVFTFTNTTGGAVDDIHITWMSPVAQVFSALDSDLQGWSNRTLSGDGLTLDMDRPDPQGDLPAAGQLTVVVRGTSPSVSTCQWTLEGVNKGAC
ncbi:MAG TPA: hypothetical protein VFT91_03675 [Dehalococcoidia bacterium]|nr:hypothetical protein [Dehalococcoidia bacterium]